MANSVVWPVNVATETRISTTVGLDLLGCFMLIVAACDNAGVTAMRIVLNAHAQVNNVVARMLRTNMAVMRSAACTVYDRESSSWNYAICVFIGTCSSLYANSKASLDYVRLNNKFSLQGVVGFVLVGFIWEVHWKSPSTRLQILSKVKTHLDINIYYY